MHALVHMRVYLRFSLLERERERGCERERSLDCDRELTREKQAHGYDGGGLALHVKG
jgi:hypothetical protein